MYKCGELLRAGRGRLVSGPDDISLKGISIDSRTLKSQEAFVAIRGKNFDGHSFICAAVRKGAACIIVQQGARKPKVPRTVAVIEVPDTEKALGDFARFQRKKFDIPLIAVTGSNGKTTCKEMTARILSGRLKVLRNEGTQNNQIGVPMALLRLDPGCDAAVLELGTNHFGEVAYLARICEPTVGIITNIGHSHLTFFKDRQGVLREKGALLAHLKKPAVAILNADDDLLLKELLKKGAQRRAFGFGIKNRTDFFASHIRYRDTGIEFTVNQKYRFRLRSLGLHNIYNALAAIAASSFFGISFEDMAERLAHFEFPQGRLKVKRQGRLVYIDDTYNSNPTSLVQALQALAHYNAKGRKIFVMGDMLELGIQGELFHRQAGSLAAGVCDTLITVGPLAKAAASAAQACGLDRRKIFSCASSRKAGDILRKKISPTHRDVVLVKGSRGMKMEEVF
ncbi:MAG TPA: UDP-N-acetylmuramoyl-tripeptide--D-alanyl-D-alanine ligase [Patescibacteria group bacterium]|nr:UDP-N-acetylmuramoyl-tripeptide--D-alanyl-D-alanine ligase [Patescibacteria group bacterium]